MSTAVAAPVAGQTTAAMAIHARAPLFLTVLFGITILAAAGNLLFPVDSMFHVSTYTITLLGKYLCYALLALSVDVIWGYCGILSLGHAVFFGLGGEALGMYLRRQVGGGGGVGRSHLGHDHPGHRVLGMEHRLEIPGARRPPPGGGDREQLRPEPSREDVGMSETPYLELRDISKYYGNIIALQGVSTTVSPGEVTCVLGDNGAGKSTFIKILAGVHQHNAGEFLIEGNPVMFNSPRDALAAGIATVYQDLAMVPLMSVWRNFFLGAEPKTGIWPFRVIDIPKAKRIAKEEMAKMGIDIRDTEQPVGTLSGGERQSVAIARASYFGAKVLILDEPTSALGVKQSGVVLKRIVEARDQGLAVIFITHNPSHAYPVGDRFVILNRGQSMGNFAKDEITQAELTQMMAGGAELEALQHELAGG